MSNIIYNKKGYYIVRVSNGYIAVNGNKVFEQGHTHLRSYKSSICAVEYAMKQKMPKTGADIYFLTSLQRLSDDQEYIDKL